MASLSLMSNVCLGSTWCFYTILYTTSVHFWWNPHDPHELYFISYTHGSALGSSFVGFQFMLGFQENERADTATKEVEECQIPPSDLKPTVQSIIVYWISDKRYGIHVQTINYMKSILKCQRL